MPLTEEQIIEIVRQELISLLTDNKLLFSNHVQFLDGRNIQVGKTTGLKLGTETTQKIGLYGTTPVVQGSAISDPSGGGTQDSEARTAINALIDRLQDIGILA